MLCNGLFADLYSWDEVVLEYKDHFRLLRYNARGQGEGPYPSGEYSLEAHTHDLFHLIEKYRELHDFDRVSLLGLSNGGRIALNFARHYPTLIDKVCVAATHHQVNNLLKAKLNSWLQASMIGGPLHRFETALPWIWSRELLETRPELVELFRAQAGRYPSDVVERLILGAMKGEIEVAKIQCPVLVLAGKDDVLTPAKDSKTMALMMPSSQYLEVAGAHAFLLEKFSSLKTTLLKFYTQPSLESHHEMG